VHFDLACFAALAGRHDDALEHFATAVRLNPRAATWAQDDEDLDPIREDPRFAAILGSPGS
jgi:hypothetical protein